MVFPVSRTAWRGKCCRSDLPVVYKAGSCTWHISSPGSLEQFLFIQGFITPHGRPLLTGGCSCLTGNSTVRIQTLEYKQDMKNNLEVGRFVRLTSYSKLKLCSWCLQVCLLKYIFGLIAPTEHGSVDFTSVNVQLHALVNMSIFSPNYAFFRRKLNSSEKRKEGKK